MRRYEYDYGTDNTLGHIALLVLAIPAVAPPLLLANYGVHALIGTHAGTIVTIVLGAVLLLVMGVLGMLVASRLPKIVAQAIGAAYCGTAYGIATWHSVTRDPTWVGLVAVAAAIAGIVYSGRLVDHIRETDAERIRETEHRRIMASIEERRRTR